MALLILFPDSLLREDPRGWHHALQTLAQTVELRIWPEIGVREDIRYALAWRPPAGVLASLPRLEAIFSLGAGVDHLLADPTLPDVPVVRFVEEDLTERMSEYVVQQVLMHHRRHLDYAEQQRRRIWRVLPQPAAAETRVGVMGLGVLGRDAAAKLKVLGFQVAGWSRTAKDLPGIACYSGEAGLAAFLVRTDILVCLLPLTPDTAGILKGALFARLAQDGPLPGPVLVNAGRGGLQVEGDILAALESGALNAASLDVFAAEPLPASSPLWDHPRVVITPHSAAVSDPAAVARYVRAQIEAHERGAPLANVVDVSRGY